MACDAIARQYDVDKNSVQLFCEPGKGSYRPGTITFIAKKGHSIDLEKIRESITATRLSGGNSKPISLRGYLLGKLAKVKDARALLKLMEDLSRNRYVPPYAMALVRAGLGEAEMVFECLDRAYAAHDVHLVFLTMDSKWDPFRTDSRFDAFLARCDFMRSARSGR